MGGVRQVSKSVSLSNLFYDYDITVTDLEKLGETLEWLSCFKVMTPAVKQISLY